MNGRIIIVVVIALLLLLADRVDAAAPLFEIKNIRVLSAPLPETKVWREIPDDQFRGRMKKVEFNVPSQGLYESVPDPKNPGKTMRKFAQCLWMEVRVREKTCTMTGVFAKIYIYDEARHLIATLPVPSGGLGGLPPFLESNTGPREIFSVNFLGW